MKNTLSCALLFLSSSVDAFLHVRPHVSTFNKRTSSQPSSSTSLSALFDPGTGIMIDPQEIGTARAAFVLCFFGAAGSATLGRQAIPIVWSKWRLTQKLKNEGPTLGGDDMLGLSSVTLYPKDVTVNDVNFVLNKNQTVAEMVKEFPLPPGKTPGYLHYETFVKAHPEANPLAVRAVFESLAITSELVTPNRAQAALDVYKNDLELMKDNLTKSKAISLSAVILLVIVLGMADYFALYHLYKGWFPEWPGAVDFPFLLFDKNMGLTSIPNYWLNEDWKWYIDH